MEKTGIDKNVEDVKKRSSKVYRYKPKNPDNPEDPLPDYINFLAMIFSMCGLMLKIKWCAWCSVMASVVSYANARSSEDSRQVLSSFLLALSSVFLTYLHSPAPMTTPW